MEKPGSVTFTVELVPEVAWQFAQFCKRSTFDMFYKCAEAHLSHDERLDRAYQMIEGLEAVRTSLAEVGYVLR